MKKKRALITNEIAISTNIAVSLIYFVFIPIVYGSSEFKVDVKGSVLLGVGYFLSLTAVIANYVITKFALLNQDWVFNLAFYTFWAAANLLLGGQGIFSKDVQGQDLIV